MSSYDPRARAHKQIQQEAMMKSTLITAHLHWLHVQFIIYICIFMFLFSLKEIKETWSRSPVGSISTGPSTSEGMKWFISLETVSEVITIFTLEYHMDMTCISGWHLPPLLFLCLPVLPVCLFYKTHRCSVIWQRKGEAWDAQRCGRQWQSPGQQSAGWHVRGSWAFYHSHSPRMPYRNNKPNS